MSASDHRRLPGGLGGSGGHSRRQLASIADRLLQASGRERSSRLQVWPGLEQSLWVLDIAQSPLFSGNPSHCAGLA
jgi:hypothetical protein